MKRFRFFNRFTGMITRLVTRNDHGNTSTATIVTSRQEQQQTPETDQPVFGILLFLTHRYLRKQATTTSSNLTRNGLLLIAIYLPKNLITRTQATTTWRLPDNVYVLVYYSYALRVLIFLHKVVSFLYLFSHFDVLFRYRWQL